MLPNEWTVLIAADNEPLRQRLLDSFLLDGHDPHGVPTRADALTAATDFSPAVILVAELEHPSAMSRLLADLRRNPSPTRPPAMVAIARGPAEADRIRPLEAGADAVVPYESSYQELRATISALMRARTPTGAPRILAVGELRLDLRNRDVTYGECPVDLTGKEFELLRALMADPERVFTKEELLREVWGFRAASQTRTLNSHACRLRRKLEQAGLPRVVHNIWGVGYRLMDPALAESAFTATAV